MEPVDWDAKAAASYEVGTVAPRSFSERNERAFLTLRWIGVGFAVIGCVAGVILGIDLASADDASSYSDENSSGVAGWTVGV